MCILEEIAERGDPNARLKSVSAETKDILDELNKEFKETEKKAPAPAEKADKFNAAHYSTGKVAAAFTSTAMVPELIHEPAVLHEDVVRYDRVKKKGNCVFFRRYLFKR